MIFEKRSEIEIFYHRSNQIWDDNNNKKAFGNLIEDWWIKIINGKKIAISQVSSPSINKVQDSTPPPSTPNLPEKMNSESKKVSAKSKLITTRTVAKDTAPSIGNGTEHNNFQKPLQE